MKVDLRRAEAETMQPGEEMFLHSDDSVWFVGPGQSYEPGGKRGLHIQYKRHNKMMHIERDDVRGLIEAIDYCTRQQLPSVVQDNGWRDVAADALRDGNVDAALNMILAEHRPPPKADAGTTIIKVLMEVLMVQRKQIRIWLDHTIVELEFDVTYDQLATISRRLGTRDINFVFRAGDRSYSDWARDEYELRIGVGAVA